MTDPRIPQDLVDNIRENRTRLRWIGVGLLVAGTLAILFPLVASISAKALFGWFLLIVGAAVLWHAFQSRSWKGALLSGGIGVLQLALGVYLAFFPLTGLVGLTALVGILFALQGVAELAIAFGHREGAQGWGWMAFSGAASLALGLLLVLGLPGTALWALGLMLGINFLSSGIGLLALVARV
ncbi:HdeD family acid-resistance protein [Roseisalinus antarcticus]|uniref:Acid-resistance membrane protein n=1 Tax=Roseisalinus antarcticus TaxID=254357 RepID=A0A1Y5SRS4_9RHOB|nr:DUF308 domain-containing protein [Roseisalinus antarcticus]SLN46277.1 acid-resistance membrane protein [Roseisalinus antarcticus]